MDYLLEKVLIEIRRHHDSDKVQGGIWTHTARGLAFHIRKVEKSKDKLLWGNLKLTVKKMQRAYDRMAGNELTGMRCELMDTVYPVAVAVVTNVFRANQDLCAAPDEDVQDVEDVVEVTRKRDIDLMKSRKPTVNMES